MFRTLERMILFASDLDNTIIHSYKNIRATDICVEIMGGKELSFMTAHSYSLFQKINDLCTFVPITTRSVEQFGRIKLTEGNLNFAVTSNGGVLLRQGEIDEEWFSESQNMVEPFMSEMKDCIHLMKRDCGIDATLVNGFFVFGKSESPEQTKKILEILGRYAKRFELYSLGSKIYVIPRTMNKGNALERLKKILKSEHAISAGDSLLDLPMLCVADKSFVPAQYPYRGENFISSPGEKHFSDFVLDSVLSEIMYTSIEDNPHNVQCEKD